ncbi:hypothetical protein AYL99_10528 [Fonsecaea erecta]|uniref:Protein HRI1 n=1 Tax=Fonsecaea erecta TaxID=1367422 RepID=A0A178Z956_9EURO|nr:hypothetical protein AYL99_10528 [Fonsecaea erecta]OAP55555.1 hypothetical protein AYL99_10528 [Fonsecaea erecta]
MVIKATPQILKRISIRWPPDPAFEDTETIALNVGGYFMDLRVTLADKTLQWSRAGERKTLQETPLTFQWTRIIDSMGSRRPDEGSMEEMANGDDLETGHFDREGNGVPVDYEEVWRDVTGKAESDDSAWILQSVDGSVFLGKVGDTFLGMQQSGKGDFAVRKEVYNSEAGVWEGVFEAGTAQSIPRAADVLRDFGQRKGQTAEKGETFHVCNREYIIRGAN